MTESAGDSEAAASFLTRLQEAELAELRRRLVRHAYRAGDVVFSQWDPGARLYIVESGKVKVSRELQGSAPVELAILGPGSMFGELSIFTKHSRTATVDVIEDAVLSSLSRPDFQDLIEMHPGIAIVCLEVLSDRLRDADQRIEDIASWATSKESTGPATDAADRLRSPLAGFEKLNRSELDHLRLPPHPPSNDDSPADRTASADSRGATIVRGDARRRRLRGPGLLADLGQGALTASTVAATLLLHPAAGRSRRGLRRRDAAGVVILAAAWMVAAAARRHERDGGPSSDPVVDMWLPHRSDVSTSSDVVAVAGEMLKQVELAVRPAAARLWIRRPPDVPRERRGD